MQRTTNISILLLKPQGCLYTEAVGDGLADAWKADLNWKL